MQKGIKLSDLFAAQPAATNGGDTAVTTTTTVPNPFDNLLGAIKNERGEQKYKTVEEALIGLSHAQTYIPQLKQELASKANELTELRNRSVSQEEYQELVQKLTTPTDQKPVTTQPQIDEEGIARIVAQQLTASQKQQQEVANQKTVVEALKSKFGDKGGEVFYGKAQELGLSKEDINALAGKSPQAVLNMFGLSGATAHKQVSTQPPAGTVRTEVFRENPSSFIGRETHVIPLGGGYEDQQIVFENSRKMVDELDAQGLSVEDLTNPKTFFKHFK